MADARVALAPFADPIIFLFIGSFILAEAMFVHGVDRRIAYTALVVALRRHSAPRILFVYGARRHRHLDVDQQHRDHGDDVSDRPVDRQPPDADGPKDEASRTRSRRFALGLMLMTSFGASVGGMATPVGTPPNLIGIGMLERITGTRISFFTWMAIGVPLVLVLFAVLVTLFTVTTARGVRMVEGGADLVRAELRKLGPHVAGRAQRAAAPSASTVLLWTLPGFLAMAGLDDSAFSREYQKAVPEGVAAMIGALLLFVLPVDWRARRFTLTWDEAVRIDWGIVLLYGGGLAMGALAFSDGPGRRRWARGITAWLPSQDLAGADDDLHRRRPSCCRRRRRTPPRPT